MKVVCIVQARMGSKRLPGKVLLPLNGHTVIGEVLTRCKRIPGVDAVVCAVPDTAQNETLALIAATYCAVSRGPEDDVLRRYYDAARFVGAGIIVRVTGDCPAISPELCGAVVAARREAGADYASAKTISGFDCEVFTQDLLERAHREATDPYDREHVTPWMRAAYCRKAQVNHFSLDTEDDYKVICAAFGHEPYQRLRAA